MNKKKIILSHSGKQHSYHVAKALNDLGYLEKFYTSSYITSGCLQRYFNMTNDQYWSRRFVKGVHGVKVESNWRFEFKEILYSKFYGQSEKTLHAVYDRDVNFDRYISSRMPKLKGDIFWGYQGSCLKSLQSAKQEGKLTICEMAAAHAPAAVRILGEEQRLHPEWSDSFDNLEFPSDYYKRLCDEPHQADLVIGASSFTLKTLREDGVEEKKLKYLPLGFELDRIEFSSVVGHVKRPLRLLYAGRVTQRKGIKYILEALKQFKKADVELHIIGNIHGSGRGLRGYEGMYKLHHAISQYELFKQYHHYDAFILPTVFEGFGLVIVEAMAAGLPAITTPNGIGPELIEDGKNGFIVPIRDTQAIVRAITQLLSKSSIELSKMRQAARIAALNFSWDAYKIRLKHLVEKELNNF